jgi:carboxymethylenebutenolidase
MNVGHAQREAQSSSTRWLRNVDLSGVPIVPRSLEYASGQYNLAGFLFLPPGEGPFPCMVLNHGSGLDRGSANLCQPGLGTTLMSWGLAVFTPHRQGYGNSPGPGWREEVPGEFGTDEYDVQLVARLDRESDDVVAALDFLQGLPEIERDHIGVMGNSFGGINTLLAASKTDRFRCAVEFAGAAMNWEHTPRLREHMIAAAHRLTQPIFFIQAENDFSIGPTLELSAALKDTGKVVEAKVFPAFGISHQEGHLFERDGALIWGPEVRRFLERWL